MKVVGYIRDSLDGPVEDILDPHEQRRLIALWAESHGHALKLVYADEGFTASSDLATRLGLADAFASLRDGEGEALVVARLDRLAPSVILQEEILTEVERLGGQLFSASPEEAAEFESPSGERLLVRQVLREIPAYRSALRDLWVRQRARRFPRTDDDEEAALARIEHLAEQGMSVRAIAQTLSADGFRPRLSHVLNPSGLARIVRRLRTERGV